MLYLLHWKDKFQHLMVWRTYRINKNDSYYKMYEIRNSIERGHQFLVEIYAECEIDKKRFHG